MVLILGWAAIILAEAEQQWTKLGDFELENGQQILDCRIGYRCFGELNADTSNVILYPTWFGGTSEHVANLIGPGKFMDNTGFCVIVVDAFGNGVSSSPSTSETQKDDTFPEFNIRDMVRSQYQLLTAKLGIKHLYGIIGGSMGSFQTLEWLVMYPDFMDKALPYLCSPALTSYDLLMLQVQRELLETAHQAGFNERQTQRFANLFLDLFARTPEWVVVKHPRNDFPDYLAGFDRDPSLQFTSYNKLSQIKAMQQHNIYAHFGGSLEKAAAAIRAEVLLIISATDHVVNPQPAQELAAVLNCRLEVLENNCGHLAIGCEMERCAAIVKDFFCK
jgi:homoserine O-acetyltransferase